MDSTPVPLDDFDIEKREVRLCGRGPFRRDRILGGLHTACFIVHTAFAAWCLGLGAGKDMEVEIYRIKTQWHPSQDHNFEVVSNGLWRPRMDVLAASFFGLSAVMHALWISVGACWSGLWKFIPQCLCWWCARARLTRPTRAADPGRAPLTVQRTPGRRWLEYAFSASIMLFGIAIVAGIRDENTLASLFMLSFTTMLCGLLTEVLSRPDMSTNTWKIESYTWRMLPHVVGFFPYVAAWSIIIVHWEKSIDDVCDRLRDRMPAFVPYIIYGCFAIFSLFTVVQAVYQKLKPSRYWETELWYCILSLTAKVFLGLFLLTNVIGRNRWDDRIASGDAWAAEWNPDSECKYPPSSPPSSPP